MQNILLGAVFFIAPFLIKFSQLANETGLSKQYAQILTGNNFLWVAKDFCFYSLVALLVIFIKSDKRITRYCSVFLGIFVLFALNTYDYLAPFVYRQGIGVFFGAILASTLLKKRNLEFAHLGVAIAAIAMSVFLVFEYYWGASYSQLASSFINAEAVKILKADRLLGVLGHANATGAYIALGAASLLHFRGYVFLPFLVLGVYLSNSSMALVTLTCVVFYYFVDKWARCRFLYVLMALSMILFAVFYSGGIDTRRLDIWENALHIFKFKIFGYGPGYIATMLPITYQNGVEVVRNLHNEFLEAYYFYGIFSLLILEIFRKCSQTKNSAFGAGCFGVFINMYGNFTFHVSATAMIAILFLCSSYNTLDEV